MKRFLAILLPVLMLLGSCAPAANNTKPQTAPVTETEESQTGSTAGKEEPLLYLIKDDKANCEVVLSVNAEWMAQKAAGDFREAMNKKIKGSRISLSTDVTESKQAVEIIIGESRRQISKDLYAKLEWYQVGVLIQDGKIAIGAGMEENLDEACNWFRRNYTSKLEGGNMTVPASFSYIEDVDLSIPPAPEFNEKIEPTVVSCGDECYLKRYTNTTPEQFKAYEQKLTDNGFELKRSNPIGENLFVTYSDGTTDVFASYLMNSALTRIVVAPAGELITQEQVKVPQNKTNDVYQLKTKDFGLSMVIHMKDGRFIVIDGGQRGEATDLVDFLCSLAPEGEKPVIAAWIITHAHPDHSFALLGTQDNSNSKRIQVERFVFNFPSDKIYQQYEPDCISQTAQVLDTMEYQYENSKVFKPHTGDKMILGDITIDFLCTQEDVLPNTISGFNDTSSVMRFTIDGQRLLVTGDMSAGEFAFCNANYDPDDLKCDIFQMPHHGWNADVGFFTSVQPKLLLLPNEDEADANRCMESSGNAALKKACTAWYGSFETYKISMPFTGDNPGVLAWKSAK